MKRLRCPSRKSTYQRAVGKMFIEPPEQRLQRLFSGWTDDEVALAWEALRDASQGLHGPRGDLWREYARRTFPDHVVCKRCGSDNHTADTHGVY